MCGTREVVEEEVLCDLYGDDEDRGRLGVNREIDLSRSFSLSFSRSRSPVNFWLERREKGLASAWYGPS